MRKIFLVLFTIAIALFGCGKPQPQGNSNNIKNKLPTASTEKTYIGDNDSIVVINTNPLVPKINLDYPDVSTSSNKAKLINSEVKKYNKPILSPEKVLNAN